MSHVLVGDEAGDRFLGPLLHTIDGGVLKHLIIGDLAYHLVQDAFFKDKIMGIDGCSGVYVVVATKPTGKWLSKRQLREALVVMRRYLRCRGKESPVDSSRVKEAVKVEMAYVRKLDDIEIVTQEVAAGRRELFFGRQDNTEVNDLMDMLELRENMMWDEDTEVIQAPFYIGCGTSIEAELQNHDQNGTMANGSEPFRLLLSCIKMLGIEMIVQQIPILKTWKRDQLPLAEAGVILLTGSYMNDECGGFNLTKGGEKRDTEEDPLAPKYIRAVSQALDQPWVQQNIADTKTQLAEREKALEALSKIQDGALPDLINLERKVDALLAQVRSGNNGMAEKELLAKLAIENVTLKKLKEEREALEEEVASFMSNIDD